MNKTMTPFGSVKTGQENGIESEDRKKLIIKVLSSKSRDITSEERADLEQHRLELLDQ